MSKRNTLFGFAAAALMTLAACAPTAAPIKTPDAMTEKTPEAMMEKTPDAMMEQTPDAMMAATPDAMMPHDAMTDTLMATPAWFSASFIQASTGATFAVQDFKDKVVLVETLAMWCPTCLQQQNQIKALHDQLGMRDDLVTLSIDVDINENLAGLKDYVAKNAFDWKFTVASAEVAREIGNLYGAQFLNPPSTPMLIIDRHGEVHPLPFGLKSATDLQKALEPFLNDAM